MESAKVLHPIEKRVTMISLQKITIPKPCHENWNQMTPVEQGRHCDQCSTLVVDFSLMSNADIIDYLSKNGNTCGRFNNSQLENINHQLGYKMPDKALRWKKWTVAAGIFGAALFSKAHAQLVTPPQKIEQGCKEPVKPVMLGRVIMIRNSQQRIVSGIVVDETKLPMPGVTISVSKNDITAVTDVDGNFRLSIPSGITQLKVDIAGYKQGTIELRANIDTGYSFRLEPPATEPVNMVTIGVVVIRKHK